MDKPVDHSWGEDESPLRVSLVRVRLQQCGPKAPQGSYRGIKSESKGMRELALTIGEKLDATQCEASPSVLKLSHTVPPIFCVIEVRHKV
jgi:hypothetical protein